MKHSFNLTEANSIEPAKKPRTQTEQTESKKLAKVNKPMNLDGFVFYNDKYKYYTCVVVINRQDVKYEQ